VRSAFACGAVASVIGFVLNKDPEKLLNDCIKDFYLRPERPSLAAVVLEVTQRLAEQQLPTPNYRTVRRRVEELDLM